MIAKVKAVQKAASTIMRSHAIIDDAWSEDDGAMDIGSAPQELTQHVPLSDTADYNSRLKSSRLPSIHCVPVHDATEQPSIYSQEFLKDGHDIRISSAHGILTKTRVKALIDLPAHEVQLQMLLY